MATIGKTVAGSLSKDLAAYVYSIAVTMPEDGDLTSITAYMASPSATAHASAGVIDDDGAAGAPGTLLRDSDEQVIPTSPAWVTFTLDSPLSLLSGDTVHLAIHGENVAGIVYYYDFTGTNVVYRRFISYTAGTVAIPDTLFNSSYEMSVYATYTASSDLTSPTLTAATIPTSGTTITLSFDEAVQIGAGGSAGIALSLSGGAVIATYASGSGSSSLVYSLSRTILSTETGTIAYTQPTDGIEDLAGNDLATFSGTTVTNNSTQTATRSVDSVTGTIAPGESITINCSNLDAAPTTQTVTLGGESLTVTNWNSGDPVCTIPATIALKWGIATYTLSVTDDTGTVNLTNQTLLTRSGWGYKDYAGPAPGASEEGFVKAALDDLTITMEVGADQAQYTTTTGAIDGDVTVGDDLVITVVPPTTKTGSYAIWDNSVGTRSAESTFTFAEEATLSLPSNVATGQTTATWGFTTDVDTGTHYIFYWTTNGAPSEAAMIAGTGATYHNGGAAVSSAGAKTGGATGLSAGTTYYAYAMHVNTVNSAILSLGSITTDAAGDLTPDAFTFTDVTDAAVGTQYQDVQQITGVDAGQTLNVTNGELSNDNQASWSTAPTLMVTGQSFVRATLTSSANRSTAANVTVTVNTVSDTFTVTTFANSDPIFTGTVSNQTNPRNTAYSLDLTTYFSDTDVDDLTYTLQAGSLPTGLTLTDGIIAGTPTVIEAQAGIVIRADDGFGGTPADTNAFSITVTNTQPTISDSAFSIQDGSTGGSVVGAVTASDANTDTLAYSIIAGNTNSDLAINSSTGQITVGVGKTLDAATTSSYSLTVQVDDQTGEVNATNTATITVTVSVGIQTTGRKGRGGILGFSRMMG